VCYGSIQHGKVVPVASPVKEKAKRKTKIKCVAVLCHE
jgi:hypothetical protein